MKTFLAVTGGLALAVLLLAAAVFPFLGRFLESADAPAPAAAIVLLNGNPVRGIYGAELYKKGLAPLIVVGRPEFSAPRELVALGMSYAHEEEDYLRCLALMGVPRNAVRLFGQGHVSTVEEVETLRRELGFNPKTLLVVTAGFHSRRARLVFEKVFPETTILVCPDPQEALEPRWWKDRQSALKVVLETAKMAYYLCGGAFRSAPAAP
jgi:uncharacterized SAM-binding protein YcdF (DUF218 family)